MGIPDVGHFVAEEAPDEVPAALTDEMLAALTGFLGSAAAHECKEPASA